MNKKTKLALVATGAGLSLLVGGVGVASAASNHQTRGMNIAGGFGNNGQDPFEHVLSVLVSKGTITQAQADAIVKEAAAERGTQDATRTAERTAHETLIANALGSDWAIILKRLQGGESLATIAGDKKDALVTVLVAEAKTHIEKGVADGRITSAQATTMEANLQARITQEITETGRMGRMMGREGGHGMGHGFGGPGTGGPGIGGPASNMGGMNG